MKNFHFRVGVGFYINNIALIMLTKPVELNDFIHPICMFYQPTKNTSFSSAAVLEYEYEARKGVIKSVIEC